MILAPRVRKGVLTVHLITAVGWIGAGVAYLGLGLAAVTRPEAAVVRAAWLAMDLIGWGVLIPMALGALLTGLILALGTAWGLFRHYWVLISFGLTLVATLILLLHMPTVSALAARAGAAEGGTPPRLGGDLFHAGSGLLVLLVIMVLNVYKPRGLTRYGWRKQQAQRPGPPAEDAVT